MGRVNHNATAPTDGPAGGGDEKGTTFTAPIVPREAQACQGGLAVWHLARLLAGVSDADVALIRARWPDVPLNGGRPDLALVTAWVGTMPDLARAVKDIDPDNPPQPTKKTRWTAHELLTTDFPEPRWAVPGLVPEGLTLFAGRPKLGKSWLALQLSCAVGTGGRVLDQVVSRGKVLHLALEDSERRIKGRMVTQGWPGVADVHFCFKWPDLAQDGGLVALQDAIAEDAYTLVIVDTLSRAMRFDQGDMGESTAVMSNLQHLAVDHRCAILMVDHYRKPLGFAGDLIDDVLGSTGKAATADAILGLVRERGKQGATLKVTGRDLEEKDLAIEWDRVTCCWQLLGEAHEVARTQGGREVLEALEALGGETTTQDLADYLSKDKGNTSRLLADLVNDGRIVKGGKVGHKQYYRLPDLPEGDSYDD